VFNVGGPEVLVILLLALIVLGPTRLPDAARQVGKMMAEVRKISTGFQNEVKNAFTDSEIEAQARQRGSEVTAPAAGATPAAATEPEAVAAATAGTTDLVVDPPAAAATSSNGSAARAAGRLQARGEQAAARAGGSRPTKAAAKKRSAPLRARPIKPPGK
jgi:sec-independent protein translocase protein TatB